MPKFLIAALLLASPALAGSPAPFNERECAGNGTASLTACVDHFATLIDEAGYQCNSTSTRDLALFTVGDLMKLDTADDFFALYPGLDAVRVMAVRSFGENCR